MEIEKDIEQSAATDRPNGLLDPTFKGQLEMGDALRFARCDREFCRILNRLKEAMAEFDIYRHQWSQIVANNNAPGRGSEYQKRLEIMQGYAMGLIDGAAWHLRNHIRGDSSV